MMAPCAGAAAASARTAARSGIRRLGRSIVGFNTTTGRMVAVLPRMRQTARPTRPGRRGAELELADVHRLGALLPLLLLVGDLRALGEGPIPVTDDAREVDEEVTAALIGRDEAETLFVAEPLDRPGAHALLRPFFFGTRT